MTTSSASLSHSAKRRQILTSDRIRGYGSMIIIVNALMLALTFAKDVNQNNIFGDRFSGDFPAFYVAGVIVNSHGRLYDFDLQDRTYHELQPHQSNTSLNFVYAPFFALLFAGFALLPLKLAYALWLVLSFALYGGGVHFTWESCDSLPRGQKWTAVIAALAFFPFAIYTLGSGQVVAFGFFFLSLAIYLESRGRSFLAGLALSLLLYKPVLFMLIGPMLVLTGRFKVIAGLALGGTVLGALSLWVVGINGAADYFNALNTYRRAALASSSFFEPRGFVDFTAFLRLLTGGRLPIVQYALSLACLVPLIILWVKLRHSQIAWALAITFQLLINIYSPFYDCSYLVIPALLTANCLYKQHGELTASFKGSLIALFILPLISPPIADKIGVQFMTLAILAFGVYQIRTALNRDTEIIVAVRRATI